MGAKGVTQALCGLAAQLSAEYVLDLWEWDCQSSAPAHAAETASATRSLSAQSMRSKQPLVISARFMIVVLAALVRVSWTPTGLYVALHTARITPILARAASAPSASETECSG